MIPWNFIFSLDNNNFFVKNLCCVIELRLTNIIKAKPGQTPKCLNLSSVPYKLWDRCSNLNGFQFPYL